MKQFCAVLSFTAMVTASSALSATIEARSGADVTSNFVIAGFGPLPLGLEARPSPPSLDLDADSSFAAPDAVTDANISTVINGVSPATPSIFFENSSNLRNGNTEGSATNVNHTLYQVLELDGDADGTNDVSERGVSGTGQAQSLIRTELYATNAASSVDNTRTITFINNRLDAFTFGIEGLVEMDVFAEATGVKAEAQASATLDFFFETAGALNIVYAAAGPFTDIQSVSGPNGATNLDFETAIAATSHFTMSGTAFARGSTPGVTEFGALTARQDFVFGITLQPGQELSMRHGVSYSQMTRIAPVPLPAGLPLLICGVALLGFLRSRRRV